MNSRRRRIGKLNRSFTRKSQEFYGCPSDDEAISERLWRRMDAARLSRRRELRWDDPHARGSLLHREINQWGSLTAFEYSLTFGAPRFRPTLDEFQF